jgi:hypothetical protein
VIHHGWLNLRSAPSGYAEEVVSAAAAVPASVAARIGMCTVELSGCLEQRGLTSQWTEARRGIEMALSLENAEPHDVALEFLYCLGQALWECAAEEERTDWLRLLRDEFTAGVGGEIDVDTVEEKRRLIAAPADRDQLERYAAASFAATAAEYVHAMWHNVTVRSGADHLPAAALRRRLEWFASRLPPNPGQALFARRRK